jgi:hypothetical protein
MSGTDAKVSIVFIGKKGRTPPLQLRRSQKSTDGAPEVSAYYLDCEDDVDCFGAVEVVNEGGGIFAAWVRLGYHFWGWHSAPRYLQSSMFNFHSLNVHPCNQCDTRE